MTAEAQTDLDLPQSLAEGLQHADDLEHAMAEIKDLLTEFNTTVKNGTRSIVSISIADPRVLSFGDVGVSIEDFFRRGATVSHVDPEDREVGELEVLAKINPAHGHEDTRRLCMMTLSDEGYPVNVDSGSQVDGCYDATALRRSLAGILRRPVTGRKLKALIQRHEERQSSGELDAPVSNELGEASKQPE